MKMPLQGKVGKGLKPSQMGDALTGQEGKGLSPLKKEMPLQGRKGVWHWIQICRDELQKRRPVGC